MKIKEKECKYALSKCKIKGFDYSLNPYMGCAHSCVYCYARFLCRYRKTPEKWGEFVDVKKNIAEALEKQVKKIKPGRVMISSVTDPYQPLEKKYKLTRSCLEILQKNGFTISLLTKNSLVTRDIDILKKFEDSDVGFTICFANDEDRKNFEPGSSPIPERLEALKKLKEEGIKTFVFIGPFVPKVSERNLEKLFVGLKEAGVKWVLLDKLNIKSGNWEDLSKVIKEKYGLDLRYYLNVEYYSKVIKLVTNLCHKYDINLDLVFR